MTAAGSGIVWRKKHGKWVNSGAVHIGASRPGAHGFTLLSVSSHTFALKHGRHHWFWDIAPF
jgi:hypothetical protein